ncbi:spore germination protein GerPE [Paenibacillus sp. HJGM_3]|uniref:spore germination protein GerPE n=1 Tax=Paenibacillus sp. HJGM_3 TaxID=3379816 RepID=UPI0038580627
MSMNRTVVVGVLDLNTITSSSLLQVGDSQVVQPRSRALAVQREIAFFLPWEGGFSNYPLFSVPIPRPDLSSPVKVSIFNEDPSIRVGGIDVTSIAASSVLKVGNTYVVDAEARVLHIRQLLRGERPVGGAGAEAAEEAEEG